MSIIVVCRANSPHRCSCNATRTEVEKRRSRQSYDPGVTGRGARHVQERGTQELEQILSCFEKP